MLRYARSAGAVAMFAIALHGSSTAAEFDKNLIRNAGAEAAAGSQTGDVVTVPRWQVTGTFTAVTYSAGGGFPGATDPGPPKRGLNFFSGGPNAGVSAGSQTINVSSLATDVDAGTVSYTLSGYLGGFSTQGDNVSLQMEFGDESGAQLGSIEPLTVSTGDRGNATGLLKRAAKGKVPVGTRKIHISMVMTRTSGVYNDGYADSLLLKLTNRVGTQGEESD